MSLRNLLWLEAHPPYPKLALLFIAGALIAAERDLSRHFFPSGDLPDMAYLNRTITLPFDGKTELEGVYVTDDKGKTERDDAGNPIQKVLPHLGDDIWVTIRNPMLMPQSMLQPKTDVPVDAEGRPLDRQQAMQAGAEVVAGLIVDWNMFDAMDLADEPARLELPATADMMRHQVPSVVGDAIAELIAKARNPR